MCKRITSSTAANGYATTEVLVLTETKRVAHVINTLRRVYESSRRVQTDRT